MAHPSVSLSSLLTRECYRLLRLLVAIVSQKDGGTLTTFMQAHKNGSVVLLDEVEKAHPEVLDLFLPCFGE